MFTVQTIASTVCDHAVVFLHQQEELPLQHEGHNIHEDFAVAILKNSNTAAGMYHGTFPGISCRSVAAR